MQFILLMTILSSTFFQLKLLLGAHLSACLLRIECVLPGGSQPT